MSWQVILIDLPRLPRQVKVEYLEEATITSYLLFLTWRRPVFYPSL